MANVKQTDILTGSIPRQLLAFFLPIWFGTLFQQLYNTADTLIVGNFVGTRALAAVGATGAFVNLLVGLFVGLCSGVGVVVSQSFGARDYDGVDRQVHTALVLSVGLGALLKDARASRVDAVLYGHTHQADCRQEPDGLWILNPGSCGYGGGTAGLIQVENRKIVSCRILRDEDL